MVLPSKHLPSDISKTRDKMSIEQALRDRSGAKCELCGATENLVVYEVPPDSTAAVDDSLLTCETCKDQIVNPDIMTVCGARCQQFRLWHGVC